MTRPLPDTIRLLAARSSWRARPEPSRLLLTTTARPAAFARRVSSGVSLLSIWVSVLPQAALAACRFAHTPSPTWRQAASTLPAASTTICGASVSVARASITMAGDQMLLTRS